MKKLSVVFILDDSVLKAHVGVRRYVISLANALAQEFNVRIFNVEYEPINDKPYYTELFIDIQFAKDNGFSTNHLVGNNKHAILRELGKIYYSKPIKEEHESGIHKCSYGTKLPCDLNLIIVAAPWVLKGQIDLVANKGIFCIAYDAIPNYYSLRTPDNKGLMKFAYQHLFGYQTFFNKYDGLLAISNETADQLVQMFPRFQNKIHAIPVFLPTGFENVAMTGDECVGDEKTVLLASPLDVRKGLKILPAYINKLNIDRLIIFGAPRCLYDEAHEFFGQISTANITWWSEVNFFKQIELYKSSRMVLFPSLHEGLGLPVLESYCCGRPIYVSNIPPLNQLVDKEFVLSNEIENNLLKLQAAIDATIDGEVFKALALKHWSSDHAVNFIHGLTNNFRITANAGNNCA